MALSVAKTGHPATKMNRLRHETYLEANGPGRFADKRTNTAEAMK